MAYGTTFSRPACVTMDGSVNPVSLVDWMVDSLLNDLQSAQHASMERAHMMQHDPIANVKVDTLDQIAHQYVNRARSVSPF